MRIRQHRGQRFVFDAKRIPGFLKLRFIRYSMLMTVLLLFLAVGPSRADRGVTFHDIAINGGAGITYHRVPSARNAISEAYRHQPVYTRRDMILTPGKPRGAPGVAIFDYDGDGDLDIYVTNGPGASNSLYSNQLVETGQVRFVDVTAMAGVGAIDQDSAGVCYGDIDNDGDEDLLVLGTTDGNRLFENQGDGTFMEISQSSGIGGETQWSSSCTMGDVNGDGLLDIAIANAFDDANTRRALFIEPFALSEHNQLYLNKGQNVFEDVSEASGIQNQAGLDADNDGMADPNLPTITWAIALVDIDQDGDVDIITADDQGPLLTTREGGVDRGFIHVFKNDGQGFFTDITVQARTNYPGAWMGLSFGDVNGDGHLDLFSTNAGAWFGPNAPPYWNSKWLLGRGDGTFIDPGVGALVVTPFGWGTSMLDYDNDGDTDIIFHGGLDYGPFVETSNPGTVLQNDGWGNFTYDAAALANSTNHSRNIGEGLAVGDLNNDGFVDVVMVSGFNAPEPIPLTRFPIAFKSPFDATAYFIPTYLPVRSGQWIYNGIDFVDGTLSIEMNSADNGNKWVKVNVMGTKGLTSAGHVNRDGVGAVVKFTPDGGRTATQPIVGGSSYASQDSEIAHFGLGSADSGMVEVLWPGGVRNRLYDVQKGEQVVFPEIPCSMDGAWSSEQEYEACVEQSLGQLVAGGVLDQKQRARFMSSALRAYEGQRANASAKGKSEQPRASQAGPSRPAGGSTGGMFSMMAGLLASLAAGVKWSFRA